MAVPSLSAFSTELRTRNIVRPNLYYVEIFSPFSATNTDSTLVSMWCAGASTPLSSILTNDNFIEAGTRRKYAYDQDYQNLVLNFYIDQDFEVKQFFDAWKAGIVPQRRNFNYPDDYTADKLNLYIINSENETTYLYEYSRIFPKTVQSIDMNYANGTTIATFSVEFVFEEVYATKFTNGSADPNTFTTKYTNSLNTDNTTSDITNTELQQNIGN